MGEMRKKLMSANSLSMQQDDESDSDLSSEDSFTFVDNDVMTPKSVDQ